jgi:hypothetical protein
MLDSGRDCEIGQCSAIRESLVADDLEAGRKCNTGEFQAVVECIGAERVDGKAIDFARNDDRFGTGTALDGDAAVVVSLVEEFPPQSLREHRRKKEKEH